MMMSWVTLHDLFPLYLHLWWALDFVGEEEALISPSARQLATSFGRDVSIMKKVMGSRLHMGGC